MPGQSPSRLRCVALLLLVPATVLLAQSSGCISPRDFEHDPAETVTVEILGVEDEDDRIKIQKTLEEMVDEPSSDFEAGRSLLTSSWSDNEMTVEVSPVRDVKAFSQKIDFGEVTELDGRTITVKFVK